MVSGVLYKLCNICNEWFPCTTEYYYKNKNSSDGFYPYCKQCCIKKTMNYIENNLETVKISRKRFLKTEKYAIKHREVEARRREAGIIKEWQRNNPDKLKEYAEKRQHKDHIITQEEWKACKEYFNNCCAYCGLPIEEHLGAYKGVIKQRDFHKEHVDDEGINDLSNCIPACKNCNSQKWKFDFEDWYRKQDFFNEERYNKIIKWLDEDYKQYIVKKENKE